MTDPSDSLLDRLLGAAFTAPKTPPPAPAPEGGAAPAGDPAISPRYRIEGEIGRGGVGIVLRGRDLELNRDVAIKILRPEHQEHSGLTRRLIEEAQIGGQLEHPGIVPVHEMGHAPDGRPFFAMKLIQGRTFSELLKERRDPAADLGRFIAIFEQICQTVAYAHARGVIHRDLKPANVMVGAFGEVQVADWGLAKVIGRPEPASEPAAALSGPGSGAGPRKGSTTAVSTARSTSPELLSQAGSVLGTLAYMPPEQARGDSDQVDARSDVFALGAMLCEILTGAPPYTGETTDVFEQARMAEIGPAIARLDGCTADADLVELAKRCLAALPADRPRHAGDVADAVACHRAALQERAHAAELAANAAQARASEERRARRLTGALAATIVVAALGGGGVYLSMEQSKRARQEQGAVPVREALRSSRDLLAKARLAPPSDVVPWHSALAAADGAIAAANAGDPGQPLRDEAAALRAEIATGLERAEQAEVTRIRDVEQLHQLSMLMGKIGVWPWDELDAAFVSTFRAWGLDFDAMTDEQTIARLRSASDPVGVCDFLLAWMGVRAFIAAMNPAGPQEPRGFGRMLVAMQTADPDPWRVRIRAAIPNSDELAKIAAEPDLWTREPRTIVFLAALLGRLEDGKHREEALRLARVAAIRFPADFTIHIDLASWLVDDTSRRFDEALEHAGAAVAIAPDLTSGWLLLAYARDGTGDFEGAVTAYDHVLELDARSRDAVSGKADSQLRAGRVDDAIATLRAGLAAAPGDDDLRFQLAKALAYAGDVAGAQAAAIALGRSPRHVTVVADAAELLVILGDAKSAVELLESTLATAKRTTPVNEILKLRARLSAALQAQGRFEDAIAQMRLMMTKFKLLPEAEANLRRAIGALEKVAALADDLSDFASGAREPASPAEAAEVALLLDMRGTTAFATELWADAIASGADLSGSLSSPRLLAVRAALRAAAGEGDDAGALTPEQRSHCRAQALGWLREILDFSLRYDALEPASHGRKSVENFFFSPDLREMRDPARRAQLPPADAAEWEKFFGDARAALRRLRGEGAVRPG